MKIRLMLDLGELHLERLLRCILHSRIERRVNVEAAIVDLVLSKNRVQIALHRVHCVIFLDLKHALGMRVDSGRLCLGGLRGAGATPQIRRAQSVGQRPIDGRFYRRRLRLPTESMPQQHRGREEHRQRIRRAGARDVRRRAVHGLEQPGGARLAQ